MAKALFDFEATGPKMMALRKGEMYEVKARGKPGEWTKGLNGSFPTDFVQFIDMPAGNSAMGSVNSLASTTTSPMVQQQQQRGSFGSTTASMGAQSGTMDPFASMGSNSLSSGNTTNTNPLLSTQSSFKGNVLPPPRNAGGTGAIKPPPPSTAKPKSATADISAIFDSLQPTDNTVRRGSLLDDDSSMPRESVILPDMADTFGGARESVAGFDNPFSSSAKEDPMAAFDSLSSKESSANPFAVGGGMNQKTSPSSDPLSSMSGSTINTTMSSNAPTLDSVFGSTTTTTNPMNINPMKSVVPVDPVSFFSAEPLATISTSSTQVNPPTKPNRFGFERNSMVSNLVCPL